MFDSFSIRIDCGPFIMWLSIIIKKKSNYSRPMRLTSSWKCTRTREESVQRAHEPNATRVFLLSVCERAKAHFSSLALDGSRRCDATSRLVQRLLYRYYCYCCRLIVCALKRRHASNLWFDLMDETMRFSIFPWIAHEFVDVFFFFFWSFRFGHTPPIKLITWVSTVLTCAHIATL